MSNPHIKNCIQIDKELRALSLSLGAEGDNFRKITRGLHVLDFDTTREHLDDPFSLGQSLADACGCRIKIIGFSEDGAFLQCSLDLDNWNLDEKSIPRPYSDRTFIDSQGSLSVPIGYEPIDDMEPANPKIQTNEEPYAPDPFQGPTTIPSDPPQDQFPHGDYAAKTQPGPEQPPLQSAEMRLARALEDSGVDLAKLAECIKAIVP